MNQTVFSRFGLTSFVAALFPIGLWAMMWLSISPGSIAKVIDPASATAFANGLRTLFPFVGILVASAVILTKLRQRRLRGFDFISPIGLIILYGVVGLAAISQSPDGLVALRWTLLYLSVPIVLAAIAWGTDPMVPLLRVINFTWLLIILATTALFAVALLKLDLAETILVQSSWLDCSHGEWYDLTAGKLRDTGVGRYAAISAIISISGLWHRNWRSMWLPVLLISGILLIYSGSRGAYGGFFAGATLVVLAHGGKKAIWVATVAILLLAPLVWATGAHQSILENCVLRGIVPSQSQPQPVVPVTPVEEQTPVAALGQEQAGADAVPGSRASTETPSKQETPVRSQVPADAPGVELIPEQESAQSEQAAQPGQPEQPTAAPQTQPKGPVLGFIPREIFSFTGRAQVWVDGWELLKLSPLIGYGFHADRIILNKHMHNSLMQALIQTGIVGTAAFVAAMVYAWVLLVNLLRNLGRLPPTHKHAVIQSGAVLAFLSVRSFPESTGAFFGVDWLILAPILFYVHVMQRSLATSESSA